MVTQKCIIILTIVINGKCFRLRYVLLVTVVFNTKLWFLRKGYVYCILKQSIQVNKVIHPRDFCFPLVKCPPLQARAALVFQVVYPPGESIVSHVPQQRGGREKQRKMRGVTSCGGLVNQLSKLKEGQRETEDKRIKEGREGKERWKAGRREGRKKQKYRKKAKRRKL